MCSLIWLIIVGLTAAAGSSSSSISGSGMSVAANESSFRCPYERLHRLRVRPRGQAHEVQQRPRARHGLALEPADAAGADEPGEEALLLMLLDEHEQVLQHAEPREDAHVLERAAQAEARHAVGGAPVRSWPRKSTPAVGRR